MYNAHQIDGIILERDWNKIVEFPYRLCYIRHRKSTHSKVDAPKNDLDCPYGHCLICLQTGEAFLFLLTLVSTSFSLVEKGQKRNNQTTKGNQQADYPYKY